MTDEKLDLSGTNPHRSAAPVRQLDATDLDIATPATQSDEETDIWRELRDAIDAISTDGVRAVVATDDATITTSIDIQEGSSRPVHAIELGVWKAYSETSSPITHVLVQADDDYTPCGRCVQTVLDYSNDALVRVMDPSGETYDELSLDQGSLLSVGRGPNEDGDHQDTDNDGASGEEESDSMPIPETPPFIDIEVSDDVGIEYVRLNAPVYHLKYETYDQTFCGTDLTHRETVSSTEAPTLLDPCLRCHGETSQQTVEEQRTELRAQLAEQLNPVRATEEDAASFDDDELAAILKHLPVEVPTGGDDAVALRSRLSQAIVDVHDDQENPSTFSREEMQALLAALDGEGTISDDPHLLVHTSDGRVARVALSHLSLQRRAGKGELALSLSDSEVPTATLAMSPRDQLYVFTNLGQVHQADAYQVPSVSRGGEPSPLSEILDLNEDETLQAAFTCRNLNSHDYVILGSRDGYIKRTKTADFKNIHRGGIRAAELEGDDVLREACLMNDGRDLLMTTQYGRAIRFDGGDVRPMGREARGVKGIELDDGDEVVTVNVVNTQAKPEVLTVTEEGYGKRTSITDYRKQSRNGRGLLDISTDDRNGPVVAVEMTASDDEFVTMSEAGRTIHATVDDISVLGRNTMGVEIMRLNSDDQLSNLSVFNN
ncbi:DNA gyrase C-terminal beta-propeller domain-containing protein [Natrarchaeobius halalkaliphilus]|nr:DNA gyrase C-terminal beta-propeller domain-containing protein [Natrarchaeobius halalkaliphilus]